MFGLDAVSVALGDGCWSVWLSMVVLTLGELITLSTAMALAARLALLEMWSVCSDGGVTRTCRFCGAA